MYAIGIDIGGTKIDVAHVDKNGSVIRRKIFDTRPSRSPQIIIEEIIKSILEIVRLAEKNPVGIGIGMAGQITKDTGIVSFSPNLIWHHVPLKSEIEKIVKTPVYVLNDVRAATWGELIYGAGREVKDFVCILLGTGIGGGIVSDGRILTGANNAAGEIGHISVELNGPICSCGNRGCVETYAAGWGIAQRAKEALNIDPAAGDILRKRVSGNHDIITAKEVIEAARMGDVLARSVMDKASEALVSAVVNILNSFNPKMLVVGGGLAAGWPEVIALISEGISRRALKATSEGIDIVRTGLGSDAPVIGAASVVFEKKI